MTAMSDVRALAPGKSRAAPGTKAARQARIADLIVRGQVSSQAELATRLGREGMAVSQGTLSRDLLDLGAVRARGPSGDFRYALTGRGEGGALEADPSRAARDRLARLCRDVLTSAQASGNLVVVRTPPGAAQFLASGIDRAGWPSVIGTIAGDDTVVLITRDPGGGQAVADELLGLLDEGSSQ